MLKKYIRKADVVLLIVLVILGIAVTIALSMTRSFGDTVEVKSDNKLYATYSLSEDRTFVVHSKNGSNKVVIKDGTVNVTHATCANQVCVKHAAISQSGESIVCLPNKLVVSIVNEGGDEYDAISS